MSANLSKLFHSFEGHFWESFCLMYDTEFNWVTRPCETVIRSALEQQNTYVQVHNPTTTLQLPGQVVYLSLSLPEFLKAKPPATARTLNAVKPIVR